MIVTMYRSIGVRQKASNQAFRLVRRLDLSCLQFININVISNCYHSYNLCKKFHSSSSRMISGSSFSKPYHFTSQRYESVEIDVDSLCVDDSSEFGVRLWITVSHLKELKKSSVYLKISLANAHLIPIASNYGFKFHNAENDTCTLFLWLKDGPCLIPPFGTHHCGVGAVVIDSNNRILLVKEREKLVGYKFPGGYVNLGENFSDAAVREVFEETNIKTKFVQILGFRHSHGVQFGRGDVYTVCQLEPLSSEISISDEIEDAKWMDVNEYYGKLKHPMMKIALDIALSKQQCGWSETSFPSILPGRPDYCLYVPKAFIPRDK